jgi:hypothetical protein
MTKFKTRKSQLDHLLTSSNIKQYDVEIHDSAEDGQLVEPQAWITWEVESLSVHEQISSQFLACKITANQRYFSFYAVTFIFNNGLVKTCFMSIPIICNQNQSRIEITVVWNAEILERGWRFMPAKNFGQNVARAKYPVGLAKLPE